MVVDHSAHVAEAGDAPQFPTYSRPERIADACVHIVGIGASVIAVVFLLASAAPENDAGGVVSLVVYGLGLVLVFSCSAAYHMTEPSRVEMKARLRRLDHAAIFLKIAGTYTPFAAISIGGVWGAALLVAVWGIALVGVPMRLLGEPSDHNRVVWLYMIQGWLVLFAIVPLFNAVPGGVFSLILIGGGLYSVGVIFHLWEALPYHNAIWHGFVLVASACMFAAVTSGPAFVQAHEAAAARMTPPAVDAALVEPAAERDAAVVAH